MPAESTIPPSSQDNAKRNEPSSQDRASRREEEGKRLIQATSNGAKNESAIREAIRNGTLLMSGTCMTLHEVVYPINGVNDLVIFKVLRCNDHGELARKFEEVQMAFLLKHNSRVLIPYETFIIENTRHGFWELIIVLELAKHSILAEIKARSKENKTWTEPQLWSFILCSVEVFADAQNLNFAHRDIKPDNFLITWAGDFCTIDFGVSKEISQNATTESATITGTPMYLSYELEEARAKGLDVREMRSINWFKSDVMSLAISVIFMALLRADLRLNDPDPTLHQPQQENAFGMLSHLSEDLRQFLRRMLTKDANRRPDFLQLLNELKSKNIQKVLLCEPTARPEFPANQVRGGPAQVPIISNPTVKNDTMSRGQDAG